MRSANLINLVLQQTHYSQKELAAKLKVSAAQISKWKAGEHISHEMEEKLKVMAAIGERDPDIVYWTGGIDQADKWMRLFMHLAETAVENSDCSYVCAPLEDETESLLWNAFYTLIEAGATIPKEFPQEIDFNYDADYEENEEAFETLYETNTYSNLIYITLKAFVDQYDFYAAYIQYLMWEDDLDLYDTEACNLEPCLFGLALAKVGDNYPILTNFKEFRYQTFKDCKKWLEIIKDTAIKNQIPLKAELMHLVSEDPGYLTHEAEAEALGFNSNRIHPDIYMNEILESLRLMHRVLPAICRKLGITEEELKLDELK